MKRHDTRPRVRVQLMKNVGDDDEAAVDLSAASGVKFIMRLSTANAGSAPDVEAAADITSASTGVVTYTWATGDTATPGVYEGEFQITWEDGGVETIPNEDYITVTVVDDLNNDD